MYGSDQSNKIKVWSFRPDGNQIRVVRQAGAIPLIYGHYKQNVKGQQVSILGVRLLMASKRDEQTALLGGGNSSVLF